MDYPLPLLLKDKKEIKISGAALMKKGKMVGQLNGPQTEALNLLMKNYQGGPITLPCPKHQKELISFNVTQAKTTILPQINNKNVKFKVKVNLTGNISEVSCFANHKVDSQEFMALVKTSLNDSVKKKMEDTVTMLQELKVDAPQLINSVRIKDYDF